MKLQAGFLRFLPMAILAVVLLTSCGNSQVEPVDSEEYDWQESYFPLSIGSVWYYEGGLDTVRATGSEYLSHLGDHRVGGSRYVDLDGLGLFSRSGPNYFKYSERSSLGYLYLVEGHAGSGWTTKHWDPNWRWNDIYQYEIVAYLDSWSVDSMTYSDVLHLRCRRSVGQEIPSSPRAVGDLYFARGIGLVEQKWTGEDSAMTARLVDFDVVGSKVRGVLQ